MPQRITPHAMHDDAVRSWAQTPTYAFVVVTDALSLLRRSTTRQLGWRVLARVGRFCWYARMVSALFALSLSLSLSLSAFNVVTDDTNQLDAELHRVLSTTLQSQNERTGVPVAFVVLPPLNGERMATVAGQARAQFLRDVDGQASVLVFYAPTDRQLNIAVDDALADQLTSDEVANALEQATLVLRAGDSSTALVTLADALCAEITRRPSIAAQLRFAPALLGGLAAGAVAWVALWWWSRRTRAKT